MEHFARQAVLLSLLDAMREHESWCGETHVQKAAFILQEGLGVPLDWDFLLYKHGPFSFSLRETLGEMRGNGLVSVEDRRPYGPSLRVTESGRQMIRSFPKASGNYRTAVSFVARQIGARDVSNLERLSTALYVRLNYGDSTLVEQADQLVKLKPHVSRNLAEAAVRDMDRLLSDSEAPQPEISF